MEVSNGHVRQNIHGFGLRFKEKGVSDRGEGLRIKNRSCLLPWIWAVCDPYLKGKILKKWQKVSKKIKNRPKLPIGGKFFGFFSPFQPNIDQKASLTFTFREIILLQGRRWKKSALGQDYLRSSAP
jgi:hypothetical protein